MYIPKIDSQEDKTEIAAFIQQNNFGSLITLEGKLPTASHIPIELFVEGEKWILKGHLAKANEQWKSFETGQALVIFREAHTYISSSWYSHLNVPTWNYIAVHLYGDIEVMDDETKLDFISYQMKKYEANSEHPVKMEHFTKESIARQLRGIVGFEIQVNNIQARYKLSRNRNEADFKNIIAELKKRKDSNSHEIARQMKKLKN